MFKKKKKRGDYSRREFLYLMLGGSAGLLGVGACGATLWAMQPQARWGVDLFRFEPKEIPGVDTFPLAHREGDFWLTNNTEGLRALFGMCPFEGINVKWVNTNHRFECPFCGSKYELSGAYIEGPTPNALTQYETEVITANTSRRTNNQPIALDISDATSIVVDIRHRIPGRLRG